MLVMLRHSLEKKRKVRGCSEVKHPGPDVMLEGTRRCRGMTAPRQRPELIEWYKLVKDKTSSALAPEALSLWCVLRLSANCQKMRKVRPLRAQHPTAMPTVMSRDRKTSSLQHWCYSPARLLSLAAFQWQPKPAQKLKVVIKMKLEKKSTMAKRFWCCHEVVFQTNLYTGITQKHHEKYISTFISIILKKKNYAHAYFRICVKGESSIVRCPWNIWQDIVLNYAPNALTLVTKHCTDLQTKPTALKRTWTYAEVISPYLSSGRVSGWTKTGLQVKGDSNKAVIQPVYRRSGTLKVKKKA